MGDHPKNDGSPAAWSIADFCQRFSIGKTHVYAEIKAGRLAKVKVGRRTLIPAEAADAWWKSQQKAG